MVSTHSVTIVSNVVFVRVSLIPHTDVFSGPYEFTNPRCFCRKVSLNDLSYVTRNIRIHLS